MSNEYEQETQQTPADKTVENDLEVSDEVLEGLDEDVAKTIKTLSAQRNHWRKKATEKKEPKPLPEQEEKPKPETKLDVNKILEEQEERVDLRLQDYSKEEIDFASRNREPGQKLSDAIKSDFVAAGIEAMRKKRKAEDGTPAPSNRTATFNGKTFADVVKGDSQADKEAAFESIIRKKVLNQSE